MVLFRTHNGESRVYLAGPSCMLHHGHAASLHCGLAAATKFATDRQLSGRQWFRE